MRGKLSCLAALALALCLLAGCTAGTVSGRDGLRLYYAVPLDTHPGGDAIDHVTVDWNSLPEGDKTARVAAVLSLLMGECHEKGFQSPIPAGTTLRSAEVKGSMDLTIADYCVALSLTQLDGVYAVRITVNGQELAYRDSNLFLASDVLLTSMDDVVRMLTAQLYFPDGEGTLVPEERLLTQYEGQSAADVVLAALADGPTEDGLLPLIPENVEGITARVEGGVCQLNLPSEVIAAMGTDAAGEMEQGIAASLLSLEGVSAVQIYTDGVYVDIYE